MKNYKQIQSYIDDINLPHPKLKSFYIVEYEAYNTDLNYEEFKYKHQFFEISFVLGYDAEISMNNEKGNIENHNLIFVSPNQEISWLVNKRYSHAKSYLILFHPDFLNHPDFYSIFVKFPFFNRYTNSLYVLNEEKIEALTAMFKTMILEYNRMDGDSEVLLSAQLQITLTYLKRELDFNQNLRVKYSRHTQIAQKFEHLVLKELNPRKTVQYYSNLLNISAVYLAECIKKSTQKTFKEIIDDFSLLKAKGMLRNPENSIQLISDELGFSERNSFSRFFKKQTGITPSEYIKTK
ncbi:MAG: helix-turn-helix domain-containing protein [Flavobacteriales bacterium]